MSRVFQNVASFGYSLKVAMTYIQGAMSSKGVTGELLDHKLKLTLDILELLMGNEKRPNGVLICVFNGRI